MKSIADFVNGVSLRECEELEKALLSGEEVLWATKPLARGWSLQHLPGTIFACFWTGFVAFWTYGALGMPSSLEELGKLSWENCVFAAFSIPFWCAGLFMFAQPWWMKRVMRHTVYVLTNRRALVVQPGLSSWSTEVYMLDEDTLKQRIVRKNGEGDLIFDCEQGERNTTKRGFMALPDVYAAEQALLAAISVARGSDQ